MDTVCSGTSCLNATKKAACIVMPPDMGVQARVGFRITAPHRMYMGAAMRLGITPAIKKAMAKLLDPHALSKYRPPKKTVARLTTSVTTFCSTKVVKRKVQG